VEGCGDGICLLEKATMNQRVTRKADLGGEALFPAFSELMWVSTQDLLVL